MPRSFQSMSRALAKAIGISTEQLIEAFVPAVEEDFDQVIAFRKPLLPRNQNWDDSNYLRWRYSFAQDGEEGHGRLWLLKLDGEILGTIGMERMTLMIDGSAVSACHPLDLMTKPSLKGVGIGAWLNLAVVEKSPVVFVLGSSAEARTLVKRIYHPLPDCMAWKLPISVLGTLRRKFKVPGLTFIVAMVWAGYSSLTRFVRFRRLRGDKLRARHIDRFPNQVDQLHEGFHLATIFRNRTSDYLNWRFINNPCTQYIALALYDSNDCIVAYSISHLVYSPINGQNEAMIDDVFWSSANDSDDSRVRAMLIETVDYLQKSNAKLIQVTAYSSPFAAILKSLGFYFRGNSRVCGVFASDAQLAARIYDESAWFITEGDAHAEG